MYRVILVCLDGSPIAEKAFRVAVEEAKLHNAVLHAVYVIQAKSAPMTGNPTGMVSTDPNVLTNIYAASSINALSIVTPISILVKLIVNSDFAHASYAHFVRKK